ncbi:hypothetical protein RUND412_000574 [Rhizina undulata]
MTRHLLNSTSSYTTDPLMDYRHPSRLTGQMPHDRSFALSRQNPRVDPMARQGSRRATSPPPSGATSTNSSGAPRRRIPVACGRCRKRKIRCSGDPGDNSGCTNCQNVGIAQGLCVFLRVQCEIRELVPDHMLMMGGYGQVSSSSVDLHHYSSSSSAASSSSSLGLPHASLSTSALPLLPTQQFSHHGLRIGGLHPMNSMGIHSNGAMSMKSLYHQEQMNAGGADGYLGNSGFSGSRAYDGMGGELTTSGAGGNGVSNGNDMYAGFPQFMLPVPDIGQGISNHSTVITGQDFLRNWPPLAPARPANNNGLYIEDQSSLNGVQQLSYMPANARMSSSTPLEGYSLFPALSSLSSSLPDGISPRNSQSEKMTLPPPIRTSADINNATTPKGAGNYSSQTMQPPALLAYNNYSSWSSDSSLPASNLPAPSSSMFKRSSSSPSTHVPAASQQTPALPAPSTNAPYNANIPFPLSSSNTSLLPSSHPPSSSILSSVEPFHTQSQSATKQQRAESDSSVGSSTKLATLASSMRTNSTSSSSRSSVGGLHQFGHSSASMRNHSADQGTGTSHKDLNAQGTHSPQQRRTLGLNKVY